MRQATLRVLALSAALAGGALALPGHAETELAAAPALVEPAAAATPPVALAAEAPAPSVRNLGSGIASYYADRLHGRRTASGEAYDRADFTAAHRTLPFGSMVRVTNPATGRAVTVRINDRGPFTRGREIDLSRAAAAELGLIAAGHATVTIEALDAAR